MGRYIGRTEPRVEKSDWVSPALLNGCKRVWKWGHQLAWHSLDYVRAGAVASPISGTGETHPQGPHTPQVCLEISEASNQDELGNRWH